MNLTRSPRSQKTTMKLKTASVMMKYPNSFEEWIKTPSGKGCIEWSSCLATEAKAKEYLHNRAWWAFQAGVRLAPEQMQKTFEWYEDQLKQVREQLRLANVELRKLKKKS